MFPNQFEFHLADLAGMTIGATPFSLYVTASPEQIKYVVGDAGAKIAVIDAAVRRALPEDQGGPARTSSTSSSWRRRAGGHVCAWRTSRTIRTRTSTREAVREGGQALRPADAHLHVGHDRAAEGRRADARQPHQVDRGLQAAHRLPADGPRHLVAAERARRRAQRAPLHPDRARAGDHDLRRPAQDRRVPARGAPELVLRGPADLGEDQGRARGQARRRAGGAGRGRARRPWRPRSRR